MLPVSTADLVRMFEEGYAESMTWHREHTAHVDTWAPAGTDATGFIGPFGPRVRRD